jgi:hypothetical protein
LFVNWFTGLTFLERFADPQTAYGWMAFPSLLVQSTDPAMTPGVGSITSERVVYLIDQISCAAQIEFVADPREQLKEVANRKRIGPKVALLIS